LHTNQLTADGIPLRPQFSAIPANSYALQLNMPMCHLFLYGPMLVLLQLGTRKQPV